ncbi:MAG: YdcF family protein [Clostridia bacterium]|nr:YdcF family protein [Clostridia bacterium]
MSISEAINVLGRFCGMRDVPELTQSVLQEKYGFPKADVMVLFGGSILAGGDLLAKAMADGVAKTYIIVGGEGHTTQTLRDVVKAEYPEIETEGLSEAEVYARYLKRVYGMVPDYLETASTNCGNNITNLLTLLKENGVEWKNVILCQDATMQRRMDAGMRKYAPEGTNIINFATYRATVEADGYTSEIRGMWNIDRYVNLLMGEIPRLRDDEHGYGPKGKNFIDHVDIPEEVEAAFRVLREAYGAEIREANPLYASER